MASKAIRRSLDFQICLRRTVNTRSREAVDLNTVEGDGSG